MRRRLARLLLTATTALVATVLLTGAATAADTEEDHGEEGTHAEEAKGFGTNDFDALIVAAGAGVVMGGIAFGMSRPGEIDRVGH